jgi:hypothetical protein
MSKSVIGDHLWAEMAEGQKIEAVQRGHATLKQLSEGLLDGSERLRDSCREFLAETDPSFGNLPVDHEQDGSASQIVDTGDSPRRLTKGLSRVSGQIAKPRLGLPEGFVPRLQRYGRGVLLELDIYQLPNGQEFIPCRPSGTLGTQRHLYALLTSQQYLDGKRGSVYIRSDGRIFDYSVDSAKPSGDFFDTGFTIYDLERTGRYAPELRPKRKRKKKNKNKAKQLKYRQAGAAIS